MKFLAIVLALVAPPAIYFPTVHARHDEELKRVDAELQELDKRIEQARAAQRKTAQFHDEVAKLGEEITKLRTILPPTSSMDALRTLTQARAEAHGLRLTRFAVGTNSITAEVIGPADALPDFFRDIANAARIIDVEYVTLRPDPFGWRTDFVMTPYVLPD